MTTAYSSLLGLALPVTGELSGTWGDTVNNYITKYLDSAVAGVQTISGTQTAVTLSVTNGATLSQAGALGTTGSAQYQIINCTGNPAGLLTITVPAQSKVYLVLNATSTSQSVKVVGTGPTTGVTIISGEKALIAWNGSDFVKVATAGGSSTFSNVTVTGTTTLSGLTASTALALDASKNVVSVTNTGTGNNVLSASPTLTGTVGAASLTLSSLTSGRVTYAGASGLLQDSANLTFDGTSLTLGGNPTLSAGTANGVLYLNASKVATSGSALTFDGNKLAIAGSSASTNRVDILNDNGNATFRVGYDTGNNLTITRNTGDANIYLNATQSGAAQVWQLAGTEGMRLTSTGLGVGTSSPSQKLHVVGTTLSYATQSQIWDGATGTVTTFRYNGTPVGDIGTGNQTISGGSTGDFALSSRAGNLIFGINTAEKMRLDTAGNLGIGTSSPAYKLDVVGTGDTSLRVRTTGTVNAASVLIYNGNGTTAAGYSYLRFVNDDTNTQDWRIGTYGNNNLSIVNAKAGTTPVVLDSSGNLGIGTTSPGARQHIYTSASTNQLQIIEQGLSSRGAQTQYKNLYNSALYIGISGDTNGDAIYYNTANSKSLFYNNSTLQMTLDTSGNLGIGTSSPQRKIHGYITTGPVARMQTNGSNAAIEYVPGATDGSGTIYNWVVGAQYNVGNAFEITPSTAAGGLTFSTPALLVTSVGSVGIGTSSPGGKLDIYQNSARYVRAYPSSGLADFEVVTNNNVQPVFAVKGTGTADLIRAYAGATQAFTIDSSGNLGLGVTPSAWASNYRALQIGTRAVINQGSNNTYIGNNWINDGTNKYIESSVASLYGQVAGAHQWFTAPSGTAGTAITFTQALTLHASGGLSLGNTTDPGATNLSVTGKAKIITSTTINSSTATTVTFQNSGAVILRDGTYGGTALIVTDTTGGLVIVSQVGTTTFVTGAPTATQIKVANNSGNIECTGGSSRNGAIVITTAFQVD